MTRFLACAALALGLLTSSGCFKADVTVPEIPYGSSPPPPAQVPKANPDDRADLLRENEQLRQRIAWLEQDSVRLEKKQRSLAKDLTEIQADIDKAAAERDRYRRAVER